MSAARFQSSMAASFRGFVAWKRSGSVRDYDSPARILGSFDRFLVEGGYEPEQIDGAVLREYVRSTSDLAPRSRNNIVSVVWQALAYAIRRGVRCRSLPERPKFPNRRVTRVHIYSSEELERVLIACRDLPPKGSLRPHTYTTLFALLATTGIRIGEALKLNVVDLDLEGSVLNVRDGKFGKSRVVPLHPTTTEALHAYRDNRLCHRPSSAFETSLFVSMRGRRLSPMTVWFVFRAALQTAGLNRPDGSFPRIHDLRHTFAVRRLIAWYREGAEVGQRLAALATYLGHADVSHTLAYLQPNEETLAEAARRFETRVPMAAAGAGGAQR